MLLLASQLLFNELSGLEVVHDCSGFLPWEYTWNMY